jgi:hypothetical protein
LLWRIFNDIADGFGISKEELEEICSDLKDEVNVSRLAMTEKTGALFTILDTDKVDHEINLPEVLAEWSY